MNEKKSYDHEHRHEVKQILHPRIHTTACQE